MPTIHETFKLDIAGKTIDKGATIAEALERMQAAHIPCLLVRNEGGRSVGIITERDIASAFARGKTARCAVADAMGLDVIAAKTKDSIEDAVRLIAQHDVRYLAVMSDHGEIVDFLPTIMILRAAAR